jgi:hypothetical protein
MGGMMHEQSSSSYPFLVSVYPREVRPMKLPFALVLAAALSFAASTAKAQSATALKTGERTTGTTKQCYYTFAGSEYSRTVESYELCPLSISISTTAQQKEPSSPTSSASQVTSQATITAFKTGEEQTGLTKQCYYNFAGRTYTKTVSSAQLCPLSIRVSN